MLGLPVARAEAALRWQGEMVALDLGALSAAEASTLSSAYAEEVALALDIASAEVFDLSGRSARVTLADASPMPADNVTTSLDAQGLTTTATARSGATSVAMDRTARWPSTSRRTTSDRLSPPPTPARPPTTHAPVNISNPLRPLRGVCYGALPCTSRGCNGSGIPSEDMVQVGYQAQWGAEGRDDLGVMARLGANAVRLYHSLGLSVDKDHSAFLDYAGRHGITVLPGYHTELANDPTECPDFDCFDTWKEATLQGFRHGYKQGDEWHAAIGGLVLLNEPDFFEGAPKCKGRGALCHVKASISALDGLLAAEKEANITSTERVKLTIAWSFAMRTSIDGKVSGPGLFGFQDIVAGVTDPSIAGYTPRATLEELGAAFRTRWVHSLNTQAPWSFVRDVIGQNYEQFLPIPWFIGEYGANGQPKSVIQRDLVVMQREVEKEGAFLGVAFFQFQTAYFKGGSEMNFGLFELQKGEAVTETAPVCDRVARDCRAWPVHCLAPELSFLPGSLSRRASAVASAWGGVVDVSRGRCGHGRRLLSTERRVTSLACELHLRHASSSEVSLAALRGDDFAWRLVTRTIAELGVNSAAVTGELRWKGDTSDVEASTEEDSEESFFAWLQGVVLDVFPSKTTGLAAVLASVFGSIASCFLIATYRHRRAMKAQPTDEAAAETPSV